MQALKIKIYIKGRMNNDKESGNVILYTDNHNICFVNIKYRFYIFDINTSIYIHFLGKCGDL